jgi:Domain of unknown function (DUF4136)
MKKFALLSIALVLLLGKSASGQDVRYNFDKEADFSKFKTYKWVVIKDSPAVDPILDKDIKGAIDTELATKGLSKVDSDDADLLIAYQTAVGTEKQFSSYSSTMGGPGWGYGPGWGAGGWYGGGGSTMTTGQTTTIYVGQLDLDMYEAAKKDIVWRGTASKTIDAKAKPEKQQKNITKAVQKLLKNYPPKVKK